MCPQNPLKPYIFLTPTKNQTFIITTTPLRCPPKKFSGAEWDYSLSRLATNGAHWEKSQFAPNTSLQVKLKNDLKIICKCLRASCNTAKANHCEIPGEFKRICKFPWCYFWKCWKSKVGLEKKFPFQFGQLDLHLFFFILLLDRFPCWRVSGKVVEKIQKKVLPGKSGKTFTTFYKFRNLFLSFLKNCLEFI